MTPHALLAALLAAVLPAQADGQPQSRPTAPPPIRVGIIGASVSGGFVDVMDPDAKPPNASFPLKKVLRAAWRDQEVRIKDTTTGLGLAMFLRPTKYGERQIKLLSRHRPQLVIGVDFVFWFGYGPHGYGPAGQQRRLALQQKGLSLLERLDAKLLLGDYPDMTGAARRMLPAHFVPKPDTRKKLNERLAAWAQKRGNVLVFPLSQFATDARTKTQVFAYGERKVSFPKLSLLQSDRLHATRLGMVILVHHLGQALPKLLTADHPLAKTDYSLPTLVRRLGVEDDLPIGQR
jgi:hypothetical protein